MRQTLFSLLRDRILGGRARIRGTFTAATLVEQLQQRKISVVSACSVVLDGLWVLAVSYTGTRQHQEHDQCYRSHLDRL